MPTNTHQEIIEQIKREIIRLLDDLDSPMSFVRLEQIPGFSGGIEMINAQLNVVVWRGLSKEAIHAVVDLVAAEIIDLNFSLLAYHIDGEILPLPLATLKTISQVKRGFRKPYKNKHWMPLVIIKGINYPKQEAA